MSDWSAQEPRFGAVNWVGVSTLYRKEVHRFLKVGVQTIAAPVATTLLFFAVFALALGGIVRTAGDTPFLLFLAPGLVMMTMVQNAFANTSSSVISAKVTGSIVDVLMPPLSPTEWTLAYIAGGITRGVLVGIATLMAMRFFVPLEIAYPALIIFHALAASMMLALLGLLGGIWAERFDHISGITNFVITPLAFLSGTFYTIDRLPPFWQTLAQLNPFYYMIDGFRAGFITQADSNLAIGIIIMIVINAVLMIATLRVVRTGWHLKP
ncbi:MAG: ABC transporter permease [Pseudomonadota bacterium]